MNIPVSELLQLMNGLTPPISNGEGIPFKRYLLLKKGDKVVIPYNSMFPITEYHDYEVIDEIKFRWNKQNEYWELYKATN